MEIPESVTSISSYVFSDCKALEKAVLPKNISIIDLGTFQYCSSLREINIPESVTEIGKWAFTNCVSLNEIKLPEGLEYIGSYAFSDTAVSYIDIPMNTHIYDDSFEGVKGLKVSCYENSWGHSFAKANGYECELKKFVYKKDENAEIVSSGSWNTNLSYTLDSSGTLTISGSGKYGSAMLIATMSRYPRGTD